MKKFLLIIGALLYLLPVSNLKAQTVITQQVDAANLPPEDVEREQIMYDLVRMLDTLKLESYLESPNYSMQADSLLYWIMQVKLGNVGANEDTTDELQGLADVLAVNDTIPGTGKIYSQFNFTMQAFFQLFLRAGVEVQIISDNGNIILATPNGQIINYNQVVFSDGFKLPDGYVVNSEDDLGGGSSMTNPYFTNDDTSTVFQHNDNPDPFVFNWNTTGIGDDTTLIVGRDEIEILKPLVGYYAPSLQSVTDRDNSTSNELVIQGVRFAADLNTSINIGDINTGKNSNPNRVISIGAGSGQNNTGYGNNFVGYYAGSSNSGGSTNFWGHFSGELNSGAYVNAFGDYTAKNNTGSHVNAMGLNSGRDNDGSSATFSGQYAGYNNSGDYVVFIGDRVGMNNDKDSVIALGRYQTNPNPSQWYSQSISFNGQYPNGKQTFNLPADYDIYIGGVNKSAQWDANSGGSSNAITLNGQPASFYLDYGNLLNTPTIPTALSELTNDLSFSLSPDTIDLIVSRAISSSDANSYLRYSGFDTLWIDLVPGRIKSNEWVKFINYNIDSSARIGIYSSSGIIKLNGGAQLDSALLPGFIDVYYQAGGVFWLMADTSAERQVPTQFSELTDDVGFALAVDLSNHTARSDNPHSVTASQVGAYTINQVNSLTDDLDYRIGEQKSRIDKLTFERYQLSTNKLLEEVDVWTRLYNLGAGTVYVTIPYNFTAMEVGDQIILQAIGGDIGVDIEPGVNLTHGNGSGGLVIANPCAARVLEKIGLNEYVIYTN